MYTPGELAQSSFAHTGFFELEKKKYLKCHVKIGLKKELGSLQVMKYRIEQSKRPHTMTSDFAKVKLLKLQSIWMTIHQDLVLMP